jgi:hypothetical protein
MYAFILCLCCPLLRWSPCYGPITRPRSPIDCVDPNKMKNLDTVRVRYKRNRFKKNNKMGSESERVKLNFNYLVKSAFLNPRALLYRCAAI